MINRLLEVIDVDCASLYSKDGFSLVTKIDHVLSSFVDEDPLVKEKPLLVLRHKKRFSNKSWLDELRSRLLFEPLGYQVFKTHQILKRIYQSRIHIVYVGEVDCIDSLWTLAQCCTQRIWLNRHCEVGYRHPPEGVMAFILAANYRSKVLLKEFLYWHDHGVMSCSDAYRKGHLVYLMPPQDFFDDALIDYDFGFSHKQGRLSDSDESENLNFNHLMELERSWLDQHKIGDDEHVCHAMIKSYKWFSPNDFESLYAFTLARFFLSQVYVSFDEQSVENSSVESMDYEPLVYIRVNQLIPPISSVASLLKAGFNIVFVAEDQEILFSSLKRIFHKIDEAFRSHSKKHSYKRQISWFCDTVFNDRHVLMEWDVGDTISLTSHNTLWNFMNLQGHTYNGLELGFWEQLEGPDLTEQVKKILQLCSLKMIPSEAFIGFMPCSVWCRFMFLEELIRICRVNEYDMNSVAKQLDEEGWGFVASPVRWGNFLQNPLIYNPDGNELNASVAPSQDVMDLGSWKHAVKMIEKPRNFNPQLWMVGSVSLHLRLFTYALFSYLKNRVNLSHFDLLLLIVKAFDYPEQRKNPKDLVNEWGRKRYECYAQLHWPKLKERGR